MSAPQRRSVSKEQVSRSISESGEAARVQQKKIDATPTIEEWKKEFGNKVKVDEATGEFSIKLTDRQEIRRAHEMQDAARRIEVERGEEIGARYEGKKQKVVRKDGRVIEMRDDLIENVKHRVRPAGRNGLAPSLFFGLSSATAKYVKGLDQLDFVWNEGWEPAPLFSRGASGVQRDPDGGKWVKNADSGEWEPEV